MNCRASLANVSLYTPTAYTVVDIFSRRMKIRKGKRARSMDTFSHRLQSSKAAVFILKPNRSPSAPCERITRYTSTRDTMNFSTNFYAKLDIPNRKERNYRKKITSARVYFCFLSPIRILDGSMFFGKLTSKSKREEKIVKRRLPRRRYR